jgi:hypothetical protein
MKIPSSSKALKDEYRRYLAGLLLGAGASLLPPRTGNLARTIDPRWRDRERPGLVSCKVRSLRAPRFRVVWLREPQFHRQETRLSASVQPSAPVFARQS